MRSIEETPQAERYLKAISRISKDNYERNSKPIIKKFLHTKGVDQVTANQLLDDPFTENTVLLFCLYSYADIPLNSQFQIIFDLNNPDDFQETNITLNLVALNGTLPVNQIDHGHKSYSFFKFEKKVPWLIERLTPVEFENEIGICKSEDWPTIKKKLITKRSTE